jgi:hypothetical protein
MPKKKHNHTKNEQLGEGNWLDKSATWDVFRDHGFREVKNELHDADEKKVHKVRLFLNAVAYRIEKKVHRYACFGMLLHAKAIHVTCSCMAGIV